MKSDVTVPARAPLRLRATFAIAIVCAYIVLGALTVLGFAVSMRNLNVVFASRFAQTQALLEKNTILSRINREVALTLKLADDPIVRKWMLAEDDQRVKDLAWEELESYRQAFTDKSFFIALLGSRHYYIHNADSSGGRIQITTLRPELASDSWFWTTLRDVETFALNVDYDRLIKATKVWINAVVRDDSGKKIGISGTGIDITEFLTSVLQSAGTNASTILVDRAGVIQAHPNAAYVLRNALAKNQSSKLTIYDLLASDAQREALRVGIGDLGAGRMEVTTLPLTVEGKASLAALSAMPEVGWYNIVLVDVSRFLRPTDVLPLAGTMIASLLLLLAVIALILGRTVLRPLTSLAAASREIAAGRYGVQLAVPRSEEMGRLTEAFNTMSATVKATTGDLEMRVQERTRELTRANHDLRESQKLITESLSYARRIQTGLLPSGAALSRILPQRLILYFPRDEVGGDLYLVRSFGDHFVVAVVDCMGHGVPGAFTSMTVHAVLSHVLDAECNTDPALIIAALDTNIRDVLHREGSDQELDSGLDIALAVCFPRREESVFAGAGLSLFVEEAGVVSEIGGDRRRVGYRAPGRGSLWTNHSVPLRRSTSLYLTTDGFLDQAGGDRGFGFGRQRFAAMIESHAELDMNEQERAFQSDLRAYQGSLPQRDDITVVGLRYTGGTMQ